MFILKSCLAKRIYIFDVCVSPTPGSVSLMLVRREEDLQWKDAPSLQLLLPSTAAVRQPPMQTCIRLAPWGSQEGATATGGSTRRGKWVVFCLFHPVGSGSPSASRVRGENTTPLAGWKWALMVQKSLSRMVELELKGCWYKLSLCCEYSVWLPSICTIIVCVWTGELIWLHILVCLGALCCFVP